MFDVGLKYLVSDPKFKNRIFLTYDSLLYKGNKNSTQYQKYKDEAYAYLINKIFVGRGERKSEIDVLDLFKDVMIDALVDESAFIEICKQKRVSGAAYEATLAYEKYQAFIVFAFMCRKFIYFRYTDGTVPSISDLMNYIKDSFLNQPQVEFKDISTVVETFREEILNKWRKDTGIALKKSADALLVIDGALFPSSTSPVWSMTIGNALSQIATNQKCQKAFCYLNEIICFLISRSEPAWNNFVLYAKNGITDKTLFNLFETIKAFLDQNGLDQDYFNISEIFLINTSSITTDEQEDIVEENNQDFEDFENEDAGGDTQPEPTTPTTQGDGDTHEASDGESGDGAGGALVKKNTKTSHVDTFIKISTLAISAFAIYSVFKAKKR
jgi:hypothetical protein